MEQDPESLKEFTDYLLMCFKRGVEWVPGPFRNPPVKYKPMMKENPPPPMYKGEEIPEPALASQALSILMNQVGSEKVPIKTLVDQMTELARNSREVREKKRD